jgi:hypothetical protein
MRCTPAGVRRRGGSNVFGVGAHPESIEIAGIVFDARAGKEGHEFVAEGAGSVVFLLVLDVAHHGVSGVCADRECGIAGLPGEAGKTEFLVYPKARASLDLANDVREGTIGAQPGKDVYVVGDASDPVRVSVESSNGSAEVLMQSGLPGRFDQALSILCGEDDVVVEAEMGRGHGR